MLFGAIGCNLAWGLVDAVMYLLEILMQRNRSLSVLKGVRAARDPEAARGLIAGAMPPALGPLMHASELEHLRAELVRLPDPPSSAGLRWTDIRGAMGVFLLVFLSTFPVVIPFIVIREPQLALRVSNGVAIAMLFVAGCRVGRFSGIGPIKSGLTMVALGVVLVLITVALGG